MANQIDYVSDWTARLRSRLFTQFRSAISWGQWVALLGAMAQDWEDAAQTLLTLLNIDDSVGVQLDNIGRIVVQPRLGVDDATYRLYLKARILANRSTGTPEDIYTVLAALYGTGAQLRYMGGYVKQFSVKVSNAILTRTQALIGADFLHDAKEAGARGIIEWVESDPSVVFTFDGTATVPGLGLDVGYFAGAAQA